MAGLAAALTHKGRIKGQADESALGQLIGVYAGSLLFHTAIGRADHQRRMLCRIIHIFVKV